MPTLSDVSVKRLADKLKSDIQTVIEESFLNKPNNSQNKQHAVDVVESFLSEKLANQGFLSLKPYISFSVEGEFDHLTITPDNFFSALLYKGIIFPPAAYFGVREFEADYGTYYWKEGIKWDNRTDPGGLYFKPKQPVDYIEVKINLVDSEL